MMFKPPKFTDTNISCRKIDDVFIHVAMSLMSVPSSFLRTSFVPEDDARFVISAPKVAPRFLPPSIKECTKNHHLIYSYTK